MRGRCRRDSLTPVGYLCFNSSTFDRLHNINFHPELPKQNDPSIQHGSRTVEFKAHFGKGGIIMGRAGGSRHFYKHCPLLLFSYEINEILNHYKVCFVSKRELMCIKSVISIK